VRNSAQVSPTLYRGGRPSRTGFSAVRQLGVRTVVSLQEHHSDQDAAEAAGLRYVALPLSPFKARDEDVERFLQIVNDPANQPVLVYCAAGGDRTGLMVGAYRIIEQDWSNQAAVRELPEYGYIPFLWKIKAYLLDLDALEWRERLQR
jgi:tyrosine-protein phosphatase SIW14